jgi:sirohydrochlorin cobaltochelatase
MKTTIVLAMHGSPPKDYPNEKLMEYMGLHHRLEALTGPAREAMAGKFQVLKTELHNWPRTKENDPYHAASYELAKKLETATGNTVLVGFNEFCDPGLEEALTEAVNGGAEQIIVATPMMTPGGEHSEIDIPEAIEGVRAANPNVQIDYAWPFDLTEVAKFLALQIKKFEK